ncbi:MAG: hypothetical protein QNJ54_27685 [Prochloraceae cyanobacterium]|nr:hypothetical protein [Prochloraceae cyanobacterium]
MNNNCKEPRKSNFGSDFAVKVAPRSRSLEEEFLGQRRQEDEKSR